MTRPTSAGCQMARFTTRAVTWDMSGTYTIRTGQTVRSRRSRRRRHRLRALWHLLQKYHATLYSAKSCIASKNMDKTQSLAVYIWITDGFNHHTPLFFFFCTCRVFEECHKKISPEPYFKACVYDVCLMTNVSISCSSMEAYAAACTDVSICIDWRNATNGLCGGSSLFPTVNASGGWGGIISDLNRLSLFVQNISVQQIRSTSLVGLFWYPPAMRGNHTSSWSIHP